MMAMTTFPGPNEESGLGPMNLSVFNEFFSVELQKVVCLAEMTQRGAKKHDERSFNFITVIKA